MDVLFEAFRAVVFRVGFFSIVIPFWIAAGIVLCILMSIYVIVMEYRKSGSSSLFKGGLGPSLAGVFTAVTILIIIPAVINLVSKMIYGVSPLEISALPPKKGAMMVAKMISMDMNIPIMTRTGQLILAIPSALLVGLSLTVPFRRKRRIHAEHTGGMS